MEREINLIEAKTKALISRPPNWIFRWGLIVTVLRFKSKLKVNKNDTLFYIVPRVRNNDDLYCTASVDAFEMSKVSVGNKVLVVIEQYGKEISVSGFVSSISRIPDQSGKYPFQITLANRDIRYLTESELFYFGQSSIAHVNYKTQKLAYKLFSFL